MTPTKFNKYDQLENNKRNYIPKPHFPILQVKKEPNKKETNLMRKET
jgi:hypothetical protein